jgi:hypothetical protein
MYKKMDELKEMKEDTYERINSKKIQTNSWMKLGKPLGIWKRNLKRCTEIIYEWINKRFTPSSERNKNKPNPKLVCGKKWNGN